MMFQYTCIHLNLSVIYFFFFNELVRILVSDYKRPVPINTLSALILELICYVLHVYFSDVVRVLVPVSDPLQRFLLEHWHHHT